MLVYLLNTTDVQPKRKRIRFPFSQGTWMSVLKPSRPLNGQPLALVHFSGIDVSSVGTISKYQDRLNLEDYPVFADLLAAYIRDLKAACAVSFAAGVIRSAI